MVNRALRVFLATKDGGNAHEQARIEGCQRHDRIRARMVNRRIIPILSGRIFLLWMKNKPD
jgi:hypothetical protein